MSTTQYESIESTRQRRKLQSYVAALSLSMPQIGSSNLSATASPRIRKCTSVCVSAQYIGSPAGRCSGGLTSFQFVSARALNTLYEETQLSFGRERGGERGRRGVNPPESRKVQRDSTSMNAGQARHARMRILYKYGRRPTAK